MPHVPAKTLPDRSLKAEGGGETELSKKDLATLLELRKEMAK